MTCHDAESLLHDALDAPLPPADAAALAAHLDACPACRDLDADLSLIHGASGSVAPAIVPAAIWPALAAQLEREGLMTAAARPARKPWQTYTWMALIVFWFWQPAIW